MNSSFSAKWLRCRVLKGVARQLSSKLVEEGIVLFWVNLLLNFSDDFLIWSLFHLDTFRRNQRQYQPCQERHGQPVCRGQRSPGSSKSVLPRGLLHLNHSAPWGPGCPAGHPHGLPYVQGQQGKQSEEVLLDHVKWCNLAIHSPLLTWGYSLYSMFCMVGSSLCGTSVSWESSKCQAWRYEFKLQLNPSLN